MADGTPQPEFNISYREVKGFTGLGVCVLRFPYQVPDHARCKHCNCIPRRIYHLLCFRHGLCFHCRKDCDGYYCDECRIDITPEQLGALRSDYNLDGILLKVLCGVCDKELPLGELEEHLCKHTNQGRMEASKVQQTANQTHMSQCPKIKRECSDCGVIVLNGNLQHHLDTECQKRVVLCGACNSMMRYDECGVHDQECPEKPVVCDDCECEVLRKEKSKHAPECPMRVVHCGNCGGFYAHSLEKEHREQWEKKKLAREYYKLELKGDHEKNAHLEICEDASIECAFKESGCSERKAIDTISELQQKIKDMERRNMSQQEEAKHKEAKLVKKIQELENRQMSKQEEARNENAKLVKRIQELENCQLEADQYRINLEDDVKVYRTVLQNLEDKVGRISKEAVTRRRVEMLNERVETCLGPLERLLNGLHDVDKE